jgi:hypothetical protein
MLRQSAGTRGEPFQFSFSTSVSHSFTGENPMMKAVVIALMSLILAMPAFAKAHKDTYPVPCSELWAAVKDTIKNSGNYSVVSLDNAEMMASYSVGGTLRQRTNSVSLSGQGATCDMQVQSTYRGLAHDDAGDFKTRVDESLNRLKTSRPAEPAKPADGK